MKRTIRIGTRGSKLALIQAEWVKNELAKRYDLKLELVKMKTTGDKILDSPLSKIGGKGLFVKEIEFALLKNEIDIAVHSMKDVPVELEKGLKIACITKREDPRDALITKDDKKLEELSSCKIGTSSLRRQLQLKSIIKDAVIENLRGNLDTRIRKLKEGKYDAIVVACAGLKRMGLMDEVTEIFSPDIMLPAIGQGALGIETREDDYELIELLNFLNHEKTKIEITAERAFLKRLEGGCQVPIAGYAELDDGILRITGMVASIDGRRCLKLTKSRTQKEAESLGIELAEDLLKAGGKEILEEVYGNTLK